MLGSLPRFSVPAGGPHPLFPALARRIRDVESVTVKKSRSQGVEELRSPGIENRELTATPTSGPSPGRPLATPRLLGLSTSRPRNSTTEPERRGLRKSANYTNEASMSLKTNKGTLKTYSKTNSILSVFCADRTQKVRFCVKHVSGRQVVPGDAEGFGSCPGPETHRIARKHKNRGNELKESLKTKDITFYCDAKRTQI
jgi:hypothetical protein